LGGVMPASVHLQSWLQALELTRVVTWPTLVEVQPSVEEVGWWSESHICDAQEMSWIQGWGRVPACHTRSPGFKPHHGKGKRNWIHLSEF
jgi:hypothetical protein